MRLKTNQRVTNLAYIVLKSNSLFLLTPIPICDIMNSMTKFNLKDFKTRPTEFEVQALAYSELKEYYPVVRGELKVKPDNNRGARFDLLVFGLDGELMFTVEVKDTLVNTHSKKTYYEWVVEVPNILISGIYNAENAVEICKREYAKAILKKPDNLSKLRNIYACGQRYKVF